MPSKGTAYDSTEVVQSALAQTGWSVEQFMTAAAEHTKARGFDPKKAAARFEQAADAIEPAAVQFANWVHTHDARAIKQRFPAFA